MQELSLLEHVVIFFFSIILFIYFLLHLRNLVPGYATELSFFPRMVAMLAGKKMLY